MSTPTSAMPRYQPLSDTQLSLYRSMLEEQWRYQVAAIVDLSYDALNNTNAEDEDGTRTTEQLLNSSLVAAAWQQLEETEDALRRLEDATYGVCGSCADAINPARLEILPAARLCVTCQSRRTAR